MLVKRVCVSKMNDFSEDKDGKKSRYKEDEIEDKIGQVRRYLKDLKKD